MIPVESPPLTDDRKRFLAAFMEETEYGPSAILSYSTMTGEVLTRNGGHYKLLDNKIEHLAGPSPDPSERI
jgi:hypothetical protein